MTSALQCWVLGKMEDTWKVECGMKSSNLEPTKLTFSSGQTKLSLAIACVITSRSSLKTTECGGNSTAFWSSLPILSSWCRHHYILIQVRRNCKVSSRSRSEDIKVCQKDERKGLVPLPLTQPSSFITEAGTLPQQMQNSRERGSHLVPPLLTQNVRSMISVRAMSQQMQDPRHKSLACELHVQALFRIQQCSASYNPIMLRGTWVPTLSELFAHYLS